MVFPNLVVNIDSCLQPYLIAIISICMLMNDNKRDVFECETLQVWTCGAVQTCKLLSCVQMYLLDQYM